MVTRRTKAYLAFALVFVLGGGVGSALTFGVVHQRHAKILRDDSFGMSHRRLQFLARRLDLDREQESKIREIFKREGETGWRLGEQMFEQCGEPIRAHRAKVDEEIRSVLRPEQKVRYDELKERGPFRGPPPRFRR